MSDRLRRWQKITAASLFVGYSGYYLGRSCLAIATPLMVEAYRGRGLGTEDIGTISSAGVAAYALGKVINGPIVDYLGGRRMFLIGMVATFACTAAFGLSSTLAVFVAIWGVNRFFQSMGWSALVKTASRWFPANRQATVMGFLSLSFLFGDAIVRFYLGSIVAIGQRLAGTPLEFLADWRAVFLVAAISLGAIALVTAAVLRSSPGDMGLEEPSANPNSVYGESGESAEPVPLAALLLPFLQSPVFWSICGINFGLTLIREAFNNWSVTFLKDVSGLSAGMAGIASLVFPLAGGLSAIAAGLLSDRLHGRHGRIVVPSLLLLTASLVLMGVVDIQGKPIVAMTLVSLTALFLIGPYSYLSGVMAIDLGGKRGSSTAAGLIDGVGYLGAIASGWGVARLAKRYEWSGVFMSLAGVCCVTLLFALAYMVLSDGARKRRLREEGLATEGEPER